MELEDSFDVIIIGGSYAGLSAALSLGRSMRKVLIVDNGNPCNRQTPHSHNFLTNDGNKPEDIREKALDQARQYPTVSFLADTVTDVQPEGSFFKVSAAKGETFTTRKVLFATGVIDTIPHIDGFADCWGKSILHCPYCHGYEVKNRKLGIMANGDIGFEMAKTIKHWAGELVVFTNGTSTLTPEQVQLLNRHNIIVIENAIDAIAHENGFITQIEFTDTEPEKIDALFTQLPFIQQCNIPEKLGCEMTEKGFILIDKCLETTIPGIYAAGDCLSLFRSVAHAVASGNKVGAIINKQLIEEDFV